ncbi:MAG TPA: polyhydroxyalkanoic acid system family protein [Phenylobacterium sp.]|jgi:putative polyhydroxyalkanoate system protein
MAQPISVTIPHQLGRAEARKRIDEGFGDLSRHLGGSAGALEKSWEGDRLSFSLTSFGQSITGYVAVADTAVTVEVLLPGFLAMIAGKVKGTLQKEGQLLLTKR